MMRTVIVVVFGLAVLIPQAGNSQELSTQFVDDLSGQFSSELDLGLRRSIAPVSHCTACDTTCDSGCDAAPAGCCSPGKPCATCSCCRCRDAMFDDWCGLKTCMAEHGIVTDFDLTHFYQGVSSGGSERTFKYGGKFDMQFTFLGEQLGLWKGFTTIMHAETQFGEALVTEAGSLAVPNTNLLWPLPGQQETSITGLLFLQALNERVSLAAGKINVADFWTMFYPNVGRGVDGFMNLNSLSAGLPWFRFLNLSINGGGLLFMNGMQPQGFIFALDTNNSSTTSGISDLYDKGVVTMAAWKFFHEVGGKPGSFLFAGGYSNRTYTSLDDVSFVSVPGRGLGIVSGQKTGAWALGAYLDQVVWADRCNDKRKLQLFTGLGLSDGNPSFARWSWFGSLEAFGLRRGREQDRMGISYFFNQVSSDLKDLVSPLRDVQNVHGGEFYYNAALTPWLHLTGDLQVIDNENAREDTAVVLGMRLKMDL